MNVSVEPTGRVLVLGAGAVADPAAHPDAVVHHLTADEERAVADASRALGEALEALRARQDAILADFSAADVAAAAAGGYAAYDVATGTFVVRGTD